MVESSFQNLVAVKRLPDSLVAQLRNLTTSLMEQGYADHTVRLKLRLLTNFGQWLTRKNLSVTDLDECLLDAFLKGKHRVDRGESKNLQQFLDHLRRQNVVPARNPARDGSPLADILNRYETHLLPTG
jgi:site-specific recombinase XerD